MNNFKKSLIKYLPLTAGRRSFSNYKGRATVVIALATIGIALACSLAVRSSPAAAAPAAAAPSVRVVMSGLDNPRGLTFGEDGELYVAEAGRGGSATCTVANGQFVRGFFQCYGATGAVSRLRNGVQRRIITGLPSYAPSNGAGATGPHDVSLRDDGGIYVAIGLGGGPERRVFFNSDFGWLIRAPERGGAWARVADISGYEFIAIPNPDGGVLDSNPQGLLAGAGRRIVVDAGGNSLLRVSKSGNISTIATFPSRAQGRGTDAVPTAVARGCDGAYYVGELTGVPFNTGAARVYRVVPGQAPLVIHEGFSFIIDLAFGPDGNLYVLQHATGPGLTGPGALIRVNRDGTRTTIAAELTNPTSFVIVRRDKRDKDDDDDDDGDRHNDRDRHNDSDRDDDDDDDDDDEGEGRLTFYISNKGTSAGIGEVIRIRP